jgi:hypothetical protein
MLLIGLTGSLPTPERMLGWTAGLVWLSAMCFWNYARCRRLHCAFTGPFFALMVPVTLAAGTGVWSLGSQTWGVLGDVIGIGGVALCVVPELIWGRYRRRA